MDASLKSASPGLLFFLGGVVLIGVSLYKPITYQEPAQISKKVPIGDTKQTKDSSALPPTTQAEK
jgi:hypothetical protein